MAWQNIIVYAIVVVCTAAAVLKLRRVFSKKQAGEGKCAGCKDGSGCGCRGQAGCCG